ncbi:MAG: hypothetical protein EAZ85_06880 [Bacteroidetes bacterium]|nr:MAG: hypothetical protein EAZ85_06880 [Bacteroidota bacterium]TAG89543.1 MAG: hypothetical protein EAZ20_06285 [Bacteroidota bacterium]
MKPFEKWETDEVEQTFGIESIKIMPLMQNWLQFQQPLTLKEEERAEELRLFIEEFASSWNEEDMKVFFIVPVLQIVNFYAYKKYRTFMEATIEASLTDAQNNLCTLRGRVEMVVATGKQRPQIPFFFLNEYKAQRKVVTDPQGQLLIAMLAAQAKNNGKNLPIYGLYNIGQFWFFVILSGKEYTTSKAFDATDKDDLKQIINALQYVKAHIDRNV